ncbi:MAG: ABC transporter permease [Bacteroidia bacterium]
MRLLAAIKKECLILLRDKAGLAILFIMPLFLITIMSLIQDAPFKDYKENKIPIVYVNNDKDSLGSIIEKGLVNSGIFSVITTINGEVAANENARQAVARGEYRLGIIIPEGATKTMNKNVENRVAKMLASFGMAEKDSSVFQPDSIQLVILFDPAAKIAFRSSVSSALDKFITRTEMETMLRIFSQKLGEASGIKQEAAIENRPLITLKEIQANDSKVAELLTNSVQHNVPAWAIFAMFYIVIPLASSMIKEREEGSALRLLLIPGSYMVSLYGKIAVYVAVCLIQFFLMMLVGIYVLPLLGLPAFEIGNNMLALLLMVIACAIAATGYGFMVGSLFSSHHQAMVFGSVSVVILAAIGGVLVPVYVMPGIMQSFSIVSPLSWSLNGLNNVFLRQTDFAGIMPDVLKLSGFFVVMILLSIKFNQMKKYK